MQQFKKIQRKSDNRLMYFREGKLVPASSIPESILDNLVIGKVAFGDKVDGVWQIVEATAKEVPLDIPVQRERVVEPKVAIEPVIPVQIEKVVPELVPKKCIFTGGPALKSRWIGGQTIYICDELINTKTTGQIVQRLREINS